MDIKLGYKIGPKRVRRKYSKAEAHRQPVPSCVDEEVSDNGTYLPGIWIDFTGDRTSVPVTLWDYKSSVIFDSGELKEDFIAFIKPVYKQNDQYEKLDYFD